MDPYSVPELSLPGFRFHPTDEELLNFYLKRTSMGKKLRSDVIGFLNIYHHDPSELPGLAKIGEREWYFFVHRDRRNGHGGRPNRTTENGFWKATGSDRQIRSISEPKKILGLRKTLVFYKGRAPKGSKTDWVMNEYRLPDNYPSPKEDVVLCKIYRKATSLKSLEEKAAVEGQSKTINPMVSPPTLEETPISCFPEGDIAVGSLIQTKGFGVSKTNRDDSDIVVPSSPLIEFGCLKYNLELEVPNFSMDVTLDPWFNQIRSPWSTYAHMLNF